MLGVCMYVDDNKHKEDQQTSDPSTETSHTNNGNSGVVLLYIYCGAKLYFYDTTARARALRAILRKIARKMTDSALAGTR